MLPVIFFSVLSILIVVGKALRGRIPLLHRLSLPSSVVGGLVGLVIFNALKDHIPADWVKDMRQVPSFLINVIFATLFLGSGMPKLRKLAGGALPQLTLAQIAAWGQYVVGIGLAGYVLMPLFNVSPAFGNLLELGFEGGHGTVGGMTATFDKFGWGEGVALGYTVATIGMIFGIIMGMALVNRAYRKGFVKTVLPFEERSESERIGIHPPDSRPSAGRQTVRPSSVDSLAWHIAVVGVAVTIGYGMLKGFQLAETCLFPEAKTRLFDGFPLFPLCMIGGVLLQGLAGLFKVDLLVDRGQMQRVSGAALDYLSVSAVATIELSVVASNWLPLTIMIVAGAVWTVAAVLFLAPRLFKEAWFERGITEFGQATGVTATGLLLLRTVDPDNETPAASSFAAKQLFHEPIMGVWVAMAFSLVFNVGWQKVFYISIVVLAFWSIVATVLIIRRRRGNL